MTEESKHEQDLLLDFRWFLTNTLYSSLLLATVLYFLYKGTHRPRFVRQKTMKEVEQKRTLVDPIFPIYAVMQVSLLILSAVIVEVSTSPEMVYSSGIGRPLDAIPLVFYLIL
eukprot:162812_1